MWSIFKNKIFLISCVVFLIGLFYKPFVFDDDDGEFEGVEISETEVQIQQQISRLMTNDLNVQNMTHSQRKLLMDSIIDRIAFPILRDNAKPTFFGNSSVLVAFAQSEELAPCTDVLTSICFKKFDGGNNPLEFSQKVTLNSWNTSK